MIRLRHHARERGSSLVTTLLVIVILAIIVTAFLQSMTVERQTARSYLNRYRAELAAQAAASQSENLIQRLFEKYPDSCTSWATFPNTKGTVFYYRTLPGSDEGSLPKDSPVDIKGLPLISGATPQLQTALSEDQTFPGGLTEDNSVNLNRTGWIGGPPGNETQAIRAQWINMLEDPSQPRDDTFDSVKGRPKNGVVARYAFWIEDESFRVNVNVAGATPRSDDTNGSSPSEIAMQAVTEAAGSGDIVQGIVNLRQKMSDNPDNQKLLSASEVNYATNSNTDYEKLKFFITDKSSALNFSRGGVKRLDLNQVVADTYDADVIHAQIARIIAAIGNNNAMPDITTGKKSFSDFGQRFFHSGTSSASLNAQPVGVNSDFNYPDIYLEKLAANIRDYIDTDSMPTIIGNHNVLEPESLVDDYSDGDYPVRKKKMPDSTSMVGFDPFASAYGPSDTIAVGQESVPLLQEYALRANLISMDPMVYSSPTQTSSQYEMEESHYFEFFNPTDKAITLDQLKVKNSLTPPFLLIANQIEYDTLEGVPPIPKGRVIQIPLDKFKNASGPLTEFPAGKTVVLTTDPTPEPLLATASGKDVSDFYVLDADTLDSFKDKRHFKGTTKSHTTDSPSVFRLFGQLGSEAGRGGGASKGSDYDTHVLIGNENGVLESFTALPLPGSLSVKPDNSTTPVKMFDQDKRFFLGGSLKGNLGNPKGGPSQTGDARSLNEQLSIRRFVQNGEPDTTRFFSSGLDSNPSSSNLGVFTNPSFTNPLQWPDYVPQNVTDAGTAYARIANAKLDSIGQLGDIYDPVRSAGSGSPTLTPAIDYARGGGRTLRIGQSELFKNGAADDPRNYGLWDGNQDSISRNRTAWRLADVFSTNHYVENVGVININGVGRDQGAAIKAAFYKLKFGNAAEDAATIKGKDLKIDKLVEAIQKRFPSGVINDQNEKNPAEDDPFWERGELSEVPYNSMTKTIVDPIFSVGNTLAGVEMKTTLDRGREELIRRVMELVATKGNVYRAYCVGESLTTNRDGSARILSRQQLKVIFEVEPVFDTPLPEDDIFDGKQELDTSSNPKTKRFRTPDHYQTKVLSVDTQ